MNGRSAWCDAFLAAVYDEAGAAPGMAAIASQPGFRVYRNTIIKACVDALAANFPAVVRLTGEQWFRSAAAEYAHRSPPSSASMLAYGHGFPAFLATVPSAVDFPFLAEVARLECMWLGCHSSADAPVLEATDLAGLDGHALAARRLTPHPSARWAWCPERPVVSLWHANRAASAAAPPDAWHGEGVLMTRPDGAVAWRRIGPGETAFLDACAAGAGLADAAAQGCAADAGLDIAPMLASLLLAGAFTSYIEPQE